MVRRPVVSGMFYENDPKKLAKQIEDCFKSKFGPGMPKKGNKQIIGSISPHAGYFYSGAGAAWTYKAIAESKKPDVFIILAPNHTGLGKTSILTDNYSTPLGEVEVDKETANLLLKGCPNVVTDIGAHLNEHSLEVQLPFLQYIFKEFKIVPIVISSPHHCMEIANAIMQLKTNFCIISSSDFTHYGPNYDYEIFEDNVKENIKKLDMGAIDLILKADYEQFIKYLREHDATICGGLPIAVMLKAIKGKFKDARLLNYYMSSDVMPDNKNSVSYASIVFYR